MFERYLLTRSSSARWAGVKAVASSDFEEPPKGSENGKKPWLELDAAGAVAFGESGTDAAGAVAFGESGTDAAGAVAFGASGMDAGGMGASSLFGSGAGTGIGTLSARAGPAASKAPIAAAKMTVACRDAISLSPSSPFPASAEAGTGGSRPNLLQTRRYSRVMANSRLRLPLMYLPPMYADSQ
jgi:hypothetical protein